jgi:hypothetical protein
MNSGLVVALFFLFPSISGFAGDEPYPETRELIWTGGPASLPPYPVRPLTSLAATMKWLPHPSRFSKGANCKPSLEGCSITPQARKQNPAPSDNITIV